MNTKKISGRKYSTKWHGSIPLFMRLCWVRGQWELVKNMLIYFSREWSTFRTLKVWPSSAKYKMNWSTGYFTHKNRINKSLKWVKRDKLNFHQKGSNPLATLICLYTDFPPIYLLFRDHSCASTQSTLPFMVNVSCIRNSWHDLQSDLDYQVIEKTTSKLGKQRTKHFNS